MIIKLIDRQSKGVDVGTPYKQIPLQSCYEYQQYQRNTTESFTRDCSCTSCNLRSSGSAEIKKWQIIDAKAHLCDLLSNDKQHSYWYDPQAKVYDDDRALFHLNKYENFCNNLRSSKKAITLEQDGVTLMKLRWNVNQLPYQGHHYQDTITHFMIKVRQRRY